ncbi:hypothetical protein MTP99_012366 [Tenebrio molitor]|jgi:Leucine-rich repeat (LRR) protein|uniref:leucine-rich repeat-containing protein 70-like n=1 Tax=Tenebrio molitor TaxID=7067 RepID=UPI00270266E0|nr:hypothetical protein MTP99_012366 [Tenebrio molitor]
MQAAMKYITLFLILGTLIFCRVYSQEFQAICDYQHDIRTYFCKNVRDNFPNIFYGNYHLQCVKCHIRTFSNKTFPSTNNLVSFNVSDSGIRFITGRAFSTLSNVQYIYLQSNSIQEIAPEAFWGLRQVYELHLENNQISGLNPGFLDDLEANTVDLSNNKIKILPNSAFEGSLGILILDLSKNLIKTVEADAFVGLESLEVLNLEHNQICHLTLGVFKHSSTLRRLNLADNKLTKFTIGTFSGLTNLNSLILANNTISVFDGNILIPFNHLSKLDVSHNGIYYFDANSIHINVPTLKTLRIDDNLLSCIHLTNVIQFFKKVHVEVVNTVGRYHVQNVNGIACTEIVLTQAVDFEQFLKVANEDTKKSIVYC